MDRNSSAFSSIKTQKFYSCQRCLNHHQVAARKDHKKICPFANCNCPDCELVEKRRILNAELARVKSMDSDGSGDINMNDNSYTNTNNTSHISMYNTDNMNDNHMNMNNISHIIMNKNDEIMSHNININTNIQDAINAPTERLPHCQRCAQHNVQNRLKGHKKFCIFKDCQCPKCKVVTERQRLMADQIKLRRRQKKQKIELQGSFSTSDSPISTSSFQDNSVLKTLSGFQNPDTVFPSAMPVFPSVLSTPQTMNNFQLLLSLCALQQQFLSSQLQNPFQNYYLTTQSPGVWNQNQ